MDGPASPWSILWLAYFIITPLYFHWTVLLEEKFLVGKYGDAYRGCLKISSRYLGVSKKDAAASLQSGGPANLT
jgi:hypothetical protein